MWKRSRRNRIESLADELTLECQSLLAGHYAEYLSAGGRLAPPSAWVNALAHCSDEELTASARGDVDPRPGEAPGTREWRQVQAVLAKDILGHVRSAGVTLAQLQRSTLVPLELDLMRSAEDCALRPGQLARMVVAAVHRDPSRPQT